MTTVKQTGYLFMILGIMGLIVLVVMLTGCEAKAANLDLYQVRPGQLSSNQKVAALIGYAINDYHWTVENIINKPRYHEMNPLLGKRPNREKLVAFGVVSVAATYLIGQIDSMVSQVIVDSIIASEYQNLYENNNRRNRKSIPIMVCINYSF